MNAETKQTLEDLYLPYKVKRRTKAQIAREAGLSVAYHAKPAVRAQAMVAIDAGGLDRLLEVVRPAA